MPSPQVKRSWQGACLKQLAEETATALGGNQASVNAAL